MIKTLLPCHRERSIACGVTKEKIWANEHDEQKAADRIKQQTRRCVARDQHQRVRIPAGGQSFFLLLHLRHKKHGSGETTNSARWQQKSLNAQRDVNVIKKGVKKKHIFVNPPSQKGLRILISLQNHLPVLLSFCLCPLQSASNHMLIRKHNFWNHWSERCNLDGQHCSTRRSRQAWSSRGRRRRCRRSCRWWSSRSRPRDARSPSWPFRCSERIVSVA